MLTASWFIHSFRKCSLPCLLWIWLVNVSCRLTDLNTWFGLELEAQFGEVKEPLGGGSLLPRVCPRGWALWFYKPGFASFSFLLLVWRWTPKSQPASRSPWSSVLLVSCRPCHCELHPSEQTLLPEVVLSGYFISAIQKRWICCSSDFPAAARVWGNQSVSMLRIDPYQRLLNFHCLVIRRLSHRPG